MLATGGNVLRGAFDRAVAETSCRKFYCATCGGISAATESELSVLSSGQIRASLLYPMGLSLKLSDFRCREVGDTFPREPAVSPYISFLMCAFRRVSDVHRETLALEWISEAHTWPDWLFDGLSYYFASNLPYRLKAEWAIILETRVIMSNCKSLQETQRLRF